MVVVDALFFDVDGSVVVLVVEAVVDLDVENVVPSGVVFCPVVVAGVAMVVVAVLVVDVDGAVVVLVLGTVVEISVVVVIPQGLFLALLYWLVLLWL